jgi:D-alanyl-D-alanine carboxypeptidase/D-alanyl-D-alanine-endopeptidase (penicillin-binding protein 4)
MRMRTYLPLIFLSFLFFACSPYKKINQSAQLVLTDSALQTAHVGISIYEPATGKYWFNYQGDKYFVPASNTKIPTCYAAMKYLGDSLVGLRYRHRYGNEIRVLPTGDPTFLHSDFKNQVVLDFYKKNNDKKFEFDITRTWNEFAWGSGWSWNDYEASYMAERSPFPIYGNVVHFKKNGVIKINMNENDSLKVEGVKAHPKYFERFIKALTLEESTNDNIKINRTLANNSFTVRYSTEKFTSTNISFVTNDEKTFLRLLDDTVNINWAHTVGDGPLSEEISFEKGKAIYVKASWSKDLFLDRRSYTSIHSQPTDSLLKPMMHRSDNFFAEQSLLMVSNEHLGFMNDAKIIDTLLKTDFKNLPQKPRWADGSGLSRYNLFTPQDFVFILNKMKNEFGMNRIKEILPTGGEGTLSSYYKTDSTFIYAKTGTLSGVVALSGFLYTKKGKELIFSVLVNNHQGSATNVRRAVEKFVKGVREKY